MGQITAEFDRPIYLWHFLSIGAYIYIYIYIYMETSVFLLIMNMETSGDSSKKNL